MAPTNFDILTNREKHTILAAFDFEMDDIVFAGGMAEYLHGCPIKHNVVMLGIESKNRYNTIDRHVKTVTQHAISQAFGWDSYMIKFDEGPESCEEFVARLPQDAPFVLFRNAQVPDHVIHAIERRNIPLIVIGSSSQYNDRFTEANHKGEKTVQYNIPRGGSFNFYNDSGELVFGDNHVSSMDEVVSKKVADDIHPMFKSLSWAQQLINAAPKSFIPRGTDPTPAMMDAYDKLAKTGFKCTPDVRHAASEYAKLFARDTLSRPKTNVLNGLTSPTGLSGATTDGWVAMYLFDPSAPPFVAVGGKRVFNGRFWHMVDCENPSCYELTLENKAAPMTRAHAATVFKTYVENALTFINNNI